MVPDFNAIERIATETLITNKILSKCYLLTPILKLALMPIEGEDIIVEGSI